MYESNGDKNRKLPLDEYLYKIKPYLRNIIFNLQNWCMENSINTCN